MASYGDPPQHFGAYPQEQLQYSDPSIYGKVDPSNAGPNGSSQDIQDLAHELHQRRQMQQAVQHAHQQHAPGQPPGHDPTDPGQVAQTTSDQSQKNNRLRKACDSCSIRKVKCDESGPPCKACAALDIPCTFERPSRRRGPPNRHAEAIKRRRLEEGGGSPPLSGAGYSLPSSPTHAAQALAALSSHTSSQHISAESICAMETLDLLIDDFFTYVHPLCPFPHEPSFREAWKRREDLTNKSFLALLASMVGALVASFPRKPRLHLKPQRKDILFFSNHRNLIHRCQQVCGLARGPGYLESDNLNVYDAATSYFLALVGVYTFRWRLGRLYFGECLTILRTLGLHKPREQTYTPLGNLPLSVGSHGANYEGSREQTVDNITLEMGRRIFWTMFVSVRSVQQSGAAFGELIIPPPSSADPYPPLPAEVDDFCIYPTHNEQQPLGLIPIIAGFNANVNVFCSYNALATVEAAWGTDTVVDWERQQKVLHQCLRRCKISMNELPPELTVYPDLAPFGTQDQQNGDGICPSFAQPQMSRDPAYVLLGLTSPADLNQSPEERRRMQYEIQKANIYASSLSTRSYLVEKYFHLRDADHPPKFSPGSQPNSADPGIAAAGLDGIFPPQPTAPDHSDLIEQEMRQEREAIVKDLLVVFGSIKQVNMEPNADNFTMKLRSLARALLDGPDARQGPLARQAQEPLAAFLQTLVKLEHLSAATDGDGEPAEGDDEDEDGSGGGGGGGSGDEPQHWADLREWQLKLAQLGGGGGGGGGGDVPLGMS